MWTAYDRKTRGEVDRPCWRLVFAYSACVIAQLFDTSSDRRLTQAVVRGALAAIGVR